MSHPEIKLTANQTLHWVFTIVYDHVDNSFTIYANGIKSYTTKEASDCPEAMREYFENWDTDEVTI